MATFKDIVGYPGYKVGDDGSVWSRHNSYHGLRANYKRLKPEAKPKGHLYVSLYNKAGAKKHYLHRLVLEAFIGPCPLGMEGCHRDGNPSNNRLSNLRWGTHASNMKDTVEHGTSTRGERNPQAKLTDKMVRDIRKLVNSGKYSQRTIADMRGIAQQTVSKIASRSRWKHVTD